MSEKISPLGHNPGERVTYSNPNRGMAAVFEWDGDHQAYSTIAAGDRVETPITSLIAALTARSLIINHRNANGRTIMPWIEPCIRFVEGREARCPFLKMTEGENLCGYPDGLIPQNGGMDCPKQEGPLKLITTVIK